MKRTLIAFSLLVLTGALMTGCEVTPVDHGAYLPVNTTVNDLENHEVLVLLDQRVQTSVTCSGIQQRTAPDGRLELTANIRNRENRRIQVQVNCVFKDGQGFPTEGEEAPFQNLILTENAQEPVHFMALNDKAKRYTIRIREAH
ncbi:MAG: hypothetical protein JWR26_92 [Pedosphaera sp.]|nr:hypothetical protein [Pedosphaera sp.]